MTQPILIFIDDEANILNSLRRALMDEPWDCRFTLSPDEALHWLSESEVSVIVSDMRMPTMDGLHLLRLAREIAPDTVRMVLSGYAQLTQVIATINQVDIFKFLTKPWSVDSDLRGILQQAVDFYQMKKDHERYKRQLETRNNAYVRMLSGGKDWSPVIQQQLKQSSTVLSSIFTDLSKEIDLFHELDPAHRQALLLPLSFADQTVHTLMQNLTEGHMANSADLILEGLAKRFPHVSLHTRLLGLSAGNWFFGNLVMFTDICEIMVRYLLEVTRPDTLQCMLLADEHSQDNVIFSCVFSPSQLVTSQQHSDPLSEISLLIRYLGFVAHAMEGKAFLRPSQNNLIAAIQVHLKKIDPPPSAGQA